MVSPISSGSRLQCPFKHWNGRGSPSSRSPEQSTRPSPAPTSSATSRRAIFHVGNVSRFTSYGVREWAKLMKEVSQRVGTPCSSSAPVDGEPAQHDHRLCRRIAREELAAPFRVRTLRPRSHRLRSTSMAKERSSRPASCRRSSAPCAAARCSSTTSRILFRLPQGRGPPVPGSPLRSSSRSSRRRPRGSRGEEAAGPPPSCAPKPARGYRGHPGGPVDGCRQVTSAPPESLPESPW